MSQHHITQIGNTAALLLPPDVLEQIGFHIGDTVEMSVFDGMLVVSSLQEIERKHKIREATRKVFTHRKSAYQRLA
jgi:antitoxin component of MazEF toxin-antitoxin module